jgi:hypothetical protein
VTPGIFNATTSLGVSEIGSVGGTNDTRAQGINDGVTASFRVWEGFNPASPLLQVTRNDGITTVGVIPGGSLIGGQGAVIALRDGALRTVLLRSPAAMFANLNARGQNIGSARAEVFQRFREVLDDARLLPRRRAEVERNASRPLAARRADLEALQPVLSGNLPIIIDADRATDIAQALDFGRQYGMRVAVSGATEGWKVAEELGAAQAYVLVGALNNIPRDFSSLGARQDNAALLHRAGAKIVISGGSDAFNARNVKYEAGVAVAFGLPWEAALRAVGRRAGYEAAVRQRHARADLLRQLRRQDGRPIHRHQCAGLGCRRPGGRPRARNAELCLPSAVRTARDAGLR